MHLLLRVLEGAEYIFERCATSSLSSSSGVGGGGGVTKENIKGTVSGFDDFLSSRIAV